MQLEPYPIELVLGSDFSASIRILDANGEGVNLNNIALEASIVDVSGKLQGRFNVLIADQSIKPGLINLSASPVLDSAPLEPGTYRRTMPLQCVYAVQATFPQGRKFPFQAQRVIARQTPQNLLAIAGE